MILLLILVLFACHLFLVVQERRNLVNVHDASLTQISAPLECYQLCSKHPEQMNSINQSSLALNWVDPPAPQDQPWHSCKTKFCDCPLHGTPDLDSLMVEASSISQQDSSLPTVDDLSMQAPVHSGNAVTLHGAMGVVQLVIYQMIILKWLVGQRLIC